MHAWKTRSNLCALAIDANSTRALMKKRSPNVYISFSRARLFLSQDSTPKRRSNARRQRRICKAERHGLWGGATFVLALASAFTLASNKSTFRFLSKRQTICRVSLPLTVASHFSLRNAPLFLMLRPVNLARSRTRGSEFIPGNGSYRAARFPKELPALAFDGD